MPLLRGGEVVGVLGIARREARPFSEREIALAETFADQAAIAVENARLFQGIQDRNRELSEALERQTATADVLRIISGSPADVGPVIEAIRDSAIRLCDVDGVAIVYLDGELIRRLDVRGWDLRPGPLRYETSTSFGARASRERRMVQIVGPVSEWQQEYPEAAQINALNNPERTELAALAVPMLRENQPVGGIVLTRAEARPFTDAQMALLQSFADQAVIAIENARLFQELQTRTHELEAASRAKSEFLSRMSHELRTPLNAIIGFAEIMEMDPATTPRQHDRVHHILAGGRHLLGLINEVLDITRIEAGHLSLSFEAVQFESVVQEVLDLERPLAADAAVQLELDNPDAFRVAVQADRQRLRQIVLNLVANAVKYNRRGGKVTLACQQRVASPSSPALLPQGEKGDGWVRLTVRDTGPGIPADQIGRLFAPFERLSADRSGVEGTGLGLAIARGLAEAMGGAIGVESVIGEGSAFWVELALAVMAQAPPGAEKSPREEAAEMMQTTATVLYIEDNLSNVDLVQDALSFRPGITLLTAPDGATGIRIARRDQPGLILLDLNLPDLQGDKVLARLRKDERTSLIPVVMVSADATQAQIDRLLANGAHAYLTKPLDVRHLLALIDEMAMA